MQITFTLTDTEVKALQFVTNDPNGWAENALRERARVTIEELTKGYVTDALNVGKPIPQTADAILDAILAEGKILTAAQQQAKFEEEMAKRIAADEALRAQNVSVDPGPVPQHPAA